MQLRHQALCEDVLRQNRSARYLRRSYPSHYKNLKKIPRPAFFQSRRRSNRAADEEQWNLGDRYPLRLEDETVHQSDSWLEGVQYREKLCDLECERSRRENSIS